MLGNIVSKRVLTSVSVCVCDVDEKLKQLLHLLGIKASAIPLSLDVSGETLRILKQVWKSRRKFLSVPEWTTSQKEKSVHLSRSDHSLKIYAKSEPK